MALASNIGPQAALTAGDPTITGTVSGTFNGGSVVVQFDTTGGGAPDGATAAITASGTSFTFDPRTVDPALVGYTGPYDLRYRAEIFDAAGAASFGPWQDFHFTLVVPPTDAHIDNLELLNDTGPSATDLVTYDPRVTGTVGGPFAGTSRAPASTCSLWSATAPAIRRESWQGQETLS
ncbi:MAG TPA: hypothetical protein VFI31_15340 [Pirellulales bacterium]|nr:hypothetical protein [Pirellulales bacterium]